MRKVLIVLTIFYVSQVAAQTSPEIETKRFYDALNVGDTASLRGFLSEDFMVTHYGTDTTFSFDLEKFLEVGPKFESGLFREEFKVSEEISHPKSTYIEVTFDFILDGVYDHSGIDVIVWTIHEDRPATISEIHSYVTPFKKKNDEEYQAVLERHLNKLLDSWHKAAAEANFDNYFNFMADDFYYLGTDPVERWSKEQFANFCRPHFTKGKAWDFKASERNFYFSEDMELVWFDEKLATWMEGCRGSGVIELSKLSGGVDARDSYGEWKLKHYNLTVTIENEKIQDFIKLRKQN